MKRKEERVNLLQLSGTCPFRMVLATKPGGVYCKTPVMNGLSRFTLFAQSQKIRSG